MKSTFIKKITVTDESGLDVEISVLKHECGGMFAIDSSFIEQCFEDDEKVIISDPFNEKGKVELTGI
ncbi:MAG: hypothetical protein ACOC4B_01665 [Bacteroidota bacterium]